MDQSLSLISAQVQFMEDRLALVHIPWDLHPYFLSPILQTLYHEVPPINNPSSHHDHEHEHEHGNENGHGHSHAHRSLPPSFLNLSITPVECSIMCPRHLANEYFAPLIKRFNEASSSARSRLSISQDDFIAMQVSGEGLEAGQRVLELTSPLAMAGISIFFISTYFSDYITVPLRCKSQVIDALEKRGFQFENSTDTFVTTPHHSHFNTTSYFSPLTSPRSPSSLSRSFSFSSPPSTPPPSSLSELQSRTFSSLRKNLIVPSVDRSLRLVQCAAHHRFATDTSSIALLREALTVALVVDKPRFLSLTLTAADPAASLLLEQRLLPRFTTAPTASTEPDDENSLLLGSKEEVLVPIMLDLRNLPLEASGIVCGVASRLADATHAQEQEHERPRGSNDFQYDGHASTSSSSSFFSDVALHNFLSSSHSSGSASGDHSTNYYRGGPVKPPSSHHQRSNDPSPTTPTHRLEPDFDLPQAVEISFLSTARAGSILVGEHELQRAVDALDAESHGYSHSCGHEHGNGHENEGAGLGVEV